MSKHIGIVACSSEGAALCYRTICLEGPRLLGRHRHPEISMHNHPLADYMGKGVGGWAALMLSSARKLCGAGADFLICPDNTLHLVFDQVAPKSPKPWLHIADVVAQEARRRGLRRLALLGTRPLVQGNVYPSRLAPLGIERRLAPDADNKKIHSIIFDELVAGVVKKKSRDYLAAVIRRLKRKGCDGVILGCTELPLIITPEISPLPVLDSTRLLAKAALRKAAAGAQAKARGGGTKPLRPRKS